MRWMNPVPLAMMFMTASPGGASSPQLPFDQDKDVRTGPEVGERIPAIKAMDQNGRWVDFEDIKGPKGAVIVFHRSADW